MIKCKTCKIEKEDNLFSRSNQKAGGRCKACQKQLGKKHYQENKEYYAKIRNKRKEDYKKLVSPFKEQPCADCGVSYPDYVMDFDHRDPSQKLFNVSEARSLSKSFEDVIAEIKKCDVVCANCHRVRTYG